MNCSAACFSSRLRSSAWVNLSRSPSSCLSWLSLSLSWFCRLGSLRISNCNCCNLSELLLSSSVRTNMLVCAFFSCSLTFCSSDCVLTRSAAMLWNFSDCLRCSCSLFSIVRIVRDWFLLTIDRGSSSLTRAFSGFSFPL